jgi:hypothetical protein
MPSFSRDEGYVGHAAGAILALQDASPRGTHP